MKQLALILLGLALSTTAWCQPQNATWYFGHHAGLKFDNAGNVTVLTDGALTSRESATCISDANGNIVLYSDGGRMYNSSHQVVTNGDSLYCEWLNLVYPWSNGGYWGALANDASILLPSFDGDSVYVMFTSSWGSNYGFIPGLVENKIDVAQNAVLLPKNQMLFQFVANDDLLSARIQAIRHANGRDWWLITHKVYSDKFWVYLYDPYGIHGPYEQQIGQVYGFPTWGGMFSSNSEGTKIHWVSPGGFSDVFDFDRCTGQLSNYLELGFPPYLQANTVRVTATAFSESGNVLYAGNEKYMYQYDLTSSSPKLTETLIFTESYYNNALPTDTQTATGAYKLGQDGKIYVARNPGDYGSDTTYQFNNRVHYLGVINNPEVLGNGCNFDYYGLYLQGKTSTFALPNTAYHLGPLIGSGCDTLVAPSVAFAAQQTSVCPSSCVTFSNQTQSVGNSVSYHWLFPSGTPSSSNDTAPTVCYPASGIYDVTLIATNPFGSDTVVMTNYITVNASPIVSISPVQDSLQATQGFANYQWSLNGNVLAPTTSAIPVQGSGTYNVTVTDNNGCSSQSSYVVTSINALVESSFVVQPNPASSKAVCSWSNIQVETLEVLDVLGRSVLQLKVGDTHQAVLNIYSLSSGVYTLRAVEKNGNALVRKLVVK